MTTALTLILVVSWSVAAWIAVADHHEIKFLRSQLLKYQSSTVVEHNVAILSKLDNGDFAYVSEEEPNGSTWRPCPLDAKNGMRTIEMLEEGIGYVAIEARWEERGTCRSILRADLGFDWRTKDNQFKYARVN